MILNIFLLFWNEILVKIFRFCLNKILNFFEKTQDLKVKEQKQKQIEEQNQMHIENLKKLKQLLVYNLKIEEDDDDGVYRASKDASRLMCMAINELEWDDRFIANDIILKYGYVDSEEINKLFLIEFECSYFHFTFGNVVSLCKDINAKLIKLGCSDLKIVLDDK